MTTKAPPNANLPIIVRLQALYRQWHQWLPHLTKTARYSLGVKIDTVFTDLLEAVFSASIGNKNEKVEPLGVAAKKLESLKFFIQTLWEVDGIDAKKYAVLGEALAEIGRMLGGWKRNAEKQNSSAMALGHPKEK